MLLLGMIISNSTLANPECLNVIKACDNMMIKKDAQIKLSEETLANSSKLIMEQKTLIGELEKDNTSLLHNPLFMATLGVLVGGVSMSLLSRK